MPAPVLMSVRSGVSLLGTKATCRQKHGSPLTWGLLSGLIRSRWVIGWEEHKWISTVSRAVHDTAPGGEGDSITVQGRLVFYLS